MSSWAEPRTAFTPENVSVPTPAASFAAVPCDVPEPVPVKVTVTPSSARL